MANRIHLNTRKHLRTEMSPYSNDRYESLEFTCDAELTDSELHNRLASAIHATHPPSHWGGCGYSCSVSKVVRETPTSGHIEIMHYQGIGD